MNLPNKITTFRMAMVPVVVALLLVGNDNIYIKLLALLVFILAAVSDAVDGHLARKDGLVTSFGKLMDPLADKLLVNSTFICFIALGFSSAVPVIIIIAREFLVTSIRMVAVEKNRVVAANNWGKLKTIIQMVSCVTILLVNAFSSVIFNYSDASATINLYYIICVLIPGMLMWISTFITIISGITYVVENKDLFTDM